MQDTEIIGDYQFDLAKPVYLHHPNNKFWEVSRNGKNVTYRVGKLAADHETDIEEVSKDYPTPNNARDTVKAKILDKLTKGYFSKSAIEKKQDKTSSIEVIKKSTLEKQQKEQKKQLDSMNNKKSEYSGEFYEKDDESVKLQVCGNKVKITRVSEGGKKDGFQIRHFESNQKAIEFCLGQETWYTSEGFKANHKKFTYTFVDQAEEKTLKQQKKTTKRKDDSIRTNNLLSITAMTDQAISHRSRNVSTCKSDRSFKDNNDDNDYKTSKLGPSTSSCIKVLLAETWSDEVDPTGWIMSEKLDGVRCFWTGTAMYSRNGNRFYPPKFFTKNWPKSQLDGQLFIDRGEFSKTISAVKKQVPIDSEWANVKYLVFDAPGLKKPFKQRIKLMEEVIKQLDNDYIKCHYHRECKGYTDLFEELEKVNKIEGEGLMLRDPESLYENRRSKSLLKVKTFHDDEAVILGYKAGTGRCTGMVGALKVRNTHGVEFEVGSGLSDEMRRKPPKIGSKITYKYQEFNKGSGKPRFPTFLRVFQDKI